MRAERWPAAQVPCPVAALGGPRCRQGGRVPGTWAGVRRALPSARMPASPPWASQQGRHSPARPGPAIGQLSGVQGTPRLWQYRQGKGCRGSRMDQAPTTRATWPPSQVPPTSE